MDVIHGLGEELRALERSVLTVGNFDGVHRGHRQIAAVAIEHASRLHVPVVAMTFEPHPLSILRPETAPLRLTLAEQKLAYLSDAGFDMVVVADSTPDFLNLPPEDFIRDVVVARFHPTHIVEGQHFGFGRKRKGNVETLRRFSGEFGYQVHVVEPVRERLPDGSMQRVSSSLIRKVLSEGQVELAARALGRLYALRGVVVEGSKRGRQLGFPTANVAVTDQLVPADGVYVGVANVGDQSHRCAVSIGTTPTFEGQQRQIEAHLIDFSGDLYGKTLTIHFQQWLRPQKRFGSKDELVHQIESDIGKVASAPAMERTSGRRAV